MSATILAHEHHNDNPNAANAQQLFPSFVVVVVVFFFILIWILIGIKIPFFFSASVGVGNIHFMGILTHQITGEYDHIWISNKSDLFLCSVKIWSLWHFYAKTPKIMQIIEFCWPFKSGLEFKFNRKVKSHVNFTSNYVRQPYGWYSINLLTDQRIGKLQQCFENKSFQFWFWFWFWYRFRFRSVLHFISTLP